MYIYIYMPHMCFICSLRMKAFEDFELHLVDPFLWHHPLSLKVHAAPQTVHRYKFAVCPQPLYRLESHRCLLEDWLSYHRHLGIEHWTIYDLDGSGLDFLSNLSALCLHQSIIYLSRPRDREREREIDR